MDFFTALILGLVEGATEFLPVSSTGHLILAGDFLNFTGEKAKCFEVVIQIGAILAVAVLYLPKFLGLLKRDPENNFSGFQGLWLLFLTCLPAGLLGLAGHSCIKLLFSPYVVIFSLALGAICMLLTEKYKPETKLSDLNQLNAKQALYIGCFQCFSLIPGFSRSASTIMGGMLLGVSRSLAAEYSFLVAVPLISAASLYDLLKSWNYLESSDFSFFALGIICAFFSAVAAIKIFLKIISKYSLKPFAYYRLALAFALAFYYF